MSTKYGISENVVQLINELSEKKDLPGNQEKIDVAHPKGKIDARDFKKLRAMKKEECGKDMKKYTKEDLVLPDEIILENLSEDEIDEIAEAYMGFKNLVGKLKKKGAKSPAALAAWIGRKKYGKSKFQKMAKEGKK